MIKWILGLSTALILSFPLAAQADEDVLFTVDGKPVTVGEFRYIYTKTNGEEADFSRESVMEYLDLYQRFKLKVARARDMGLDTIVALQNELEGYRKQLADNYLVDREVTEGLVEQLHAHKQLDVDFSHLLVQTNGVDTAAAYARAQELASRLTADNFSQIAAEESDDTGSKARGGRIGYVAAPLPNGLHRLEEALYDAPTGEVAGPVRTAAGYHLFVKHAERPAMGEVEVAHVFVRKPAPESATADQLAAARQKMEEARAAIEEGQPFEAVANRYSEDSRTARQGGYIGFFGINQYHKTFTEAAFGLEDGEVSEIVESPTGFHLLKRISHRGLQPLDEQRPLLEAAVKQDSRFQEGRQSMIERLKERNGAKTMQQNLDSYVANLDSSFFEVSHDFSGEQASALWRIGEETLTAADFGEYLTSNARLRGSLQRRYDVEGAARELFERWTDQRTEAYAEAQLEEQFPEFKALMREYREGILLFEATKLEVWDKAGEDTTGLEAFYAENSTDYTYGARAVVETYSVPDTIGIPAMELLERAYETDVNDINNDYPGVAVSTERYEADRLPEGLEMKPGSMHGPTDGSGEAMLVRSIEDPRPKELNEARGYVIADYQDQLERQWVDTLRKEYTVKVNKKVLNKLIES